MNRCLTDLYSAKLPASRMGEILHRYCLGVYDLMERIVTAFPHLLLEGCSGGGGRFDAGLLYYAPQSWMSDDTDAIERLKIQFGSSLAYPVSSFGAHVSVVPNHQTGRSVPMWTRAVVAMSGTFGYELDVSRLSEDDKVTVIASNVYYHKYYDTIHNGDMYRLVTPFENQFYCAWMFVSRDGKQAVLNVVQVRDMPMSPLIIVKLKGLEKDAMYNCNRYPGQVFSGSVLMHAGIALPFQGGDGQALQYELNKV
jgi:alpha-galactosidase